MESMKKFNKILFLIVGFFVFCGSVDAACSGYSDLVKSGFTKACNESSENGYKCKVQNNQCVRTNEKLFNVCKSSYNTRECTGHHFKWADGCCDTSKCETGYTLKNGTCKKNTSTGGFCGNSTGVSEMTSKYGSNITSGACNGYHETKWYSVWNTSSKCCSISVRKTSSGSTSSGSTSSSSQTAKSTGTVASQLSDEDWCKSQGNYYYNGNKANPGCYVLNQENCDIFGFYWSNGTCDTTKEAINGYRYLENDAVADGKEAIACGDKFWVEYCDVQNGTQYCYGIRGGELRQVYRNKIDKDEADAKSYCTGSTENDDKEELTGTKCSTNDNKTIKKNTGKDEYKFCYQQGDSQSKIESDIRKKYKCDSGYTLKDIYQKDSKCVDKYCEGIYSVNCSKNGNVKPVLSITSGIMQSDGYGVITVKASPIQGTIEKYYVSEEYTDPTESSDGWIKTNGTSFTIRDNVAGTKYIWVMDSEGNISNGGSGSIIDTVNTNTTVKKLELYDADGNIQTPSKTAYNTDVVKSSKYVMMANDLKDESKLADAFNPFETEYKLEVSSPTISVYATLTSTDSKYVEGYEPRTVNLKYGMNTILIKIQNNEGKVRTYTVLVYRNDDRTSDNTLSELSVSEGNIEFNSNVTDYKIKISKDVNSVDVNATISSDLAGFDTGYEPGTVETKDNVTTKLIKVISQTGSTRTYVLTFVKDNSDTITKKSLQLDKVVIPGAYLPFDSEVANYSLSVGYETESIGLKMVTKDENSRTVIRYKTKNDNDYKVGTDTGIKLDVGENFIEVMVIDKNNDYSYYRFTIIRKEFGLGISNDKTLSTLEVLGHDIKFNPNKKDYTVKIKQEKTLVITAIPANNRAEVFIRGNDELTGFSTVRIKVVAENGDYETYSIDIKKDAFNKTIEIASIIVGAVIILVSSCIIVIKKKATRNREYYQE